jgi:hypothetical protein
MKYKNAKNGKLTRIWKEAIVVYFKKRFRLLPVKTGKSTGHRLNNMLNKG